MMSKEYIISVLGILLSLFLFEPQLALGATKNWTGCPVRSTYSVDPGPRFNVSWVVTGENRVIAFQSDHIKLGGGKGKMTLSQLNRWKAMLNQLRTAAASKVKVTVYYDDASRKVQAFIARWNQPC